MRIAKIEINNFRCFGPKGFIWEPRQGLNVMVGENSTGKSTLSLALANARNTVVNAFQPSAADWWNRETMQPMAISVKIKLDKTESKRLLSLLTPDPLTKQIPAGSRESILTMIMQSMCANILFGFQAVGTPIKSFEPFLKLGPLYIRSNQASPVKDISGVVNDWLDLLKRLSTSQGRTFEDIVKDHFNSATNGVINLPHDVQRFVGSLLTDGLKVFQEIRQRPTGGGDALDSLNGSETAGVLQRLKNSDDPKEIQRYHDICNSFSEMFPLLKLDSVREGGVQKITILRTDTKVRIPEPQVGMGITEIIIMLTNLVGRDDLIFVIEEPELHLHPHAQRELSRVIAARSTVNQIFVISHSDYFVDLSDLGSHVVLRQKEGQTVKFQVDPSLLDEFTITRLATELDEHDGRDLFFSRAVVIVEGATERGALPTLSVKLGKSFDKYGISTIKVGTKNNWSIYVKLAISLDLKYCVINDKDALMNIERTIKLHGGDLPTSSVFFQLNELKMLDEKQIEELWSAAKLIEESDGKKTYSETSYDILKTISEARGIFVLTDDFEGVLCSGGCELMNQAKKSVGGSKIRQGRYLANHVEAKDIPPEIHEIINKIIQVVSGHVRTNHFADNV